MLRNVDLIQAERLGHQDQSKPKEKRHERAFFDKAFGFIFIGKLFDPRDKQIFQPKPQNGEKITVQNAPKAQKRTVHGIIQKCGDHKRQKKHRRQLADIFANIGVIGFLILCDKGIIEVDLTALKGIKEIHIPQHFQNKNKMIDGKIISSAHKRKRQRIARDRRDDHKFSCVQIKGVLFALLPFIRAAVKPHESNQQNHDATDRNKKLRHIIFR